MLTGAEFSVEEFRKGYNCSQALVSAYSEELGLDKELALKVSSAFGAAWAARAMYAGR